MRLASALTSKRQKPSSESRDNPAKLAPGRSLGTLRGGYESRGVQNPQPILDLLETLICTWSVFSQDKSHCFTY